jgi:hypothetical protein
MMLQVDDEMAQTWKNFSTYQLACIDEFLLKEIHTSCAKGDGDAQLHYYMNENMMLFLCESGQQGFKCVVMEDAISILIFV